MLEHAASHSNSFPLEGKVHSHTKMEFSHKQPEPSSQHENNCSNTTVLLQQSTSVPAFLDAAPPSQATRPHSQQMALPEFVVGGAPAPTLTSVSANLQSTDSTCSSDSEESLDIATLPRRARRNAIVACDPAEDPRADLLLAMVRSLSILCFSFSCCFDGCNFCVTEHLANFAQTTPSFASMAMEIGARPPLATKMGMGTWLKGDARDCSLSAQFSSHGPKSSTDHSDKPPVTTLHEFPAPPPSTSGTSTPSSSYVARTRHHNKRLDGATGTGPSLYSSNNSPTTTAAATAPPHHNSSHASAGKVPCRLAGLRPRPLRSCPYSLPS